MERAVSQIIGTQVCNVPLFISFCWPFHTMTVYVIQMKAIQDKFVHFEELDLQIEKERQQLEQMKNLLFADQLTLLFQRSAAKKTGEGNDGDTRIC